MQAIRVLAICALLGVLPGCALEDEGEAQARLSAWAWPERALWFKATARCAVGVFRLDVLGFRPGLVVLPDPREGLARLRRGETVGFAGPGLTPDALSQQVMSADLPTGLGLLGVATEARPCMSDEVAVGVGALLLGDGVTTIYAPAAAVLVLVHPAERRAVYMRVAR